MTITMLVRRTQNIINKVVVVLVVLVIFCATAYRIYLHYESRHWNYDGNFAILNSEELSVTVYVPDREAVYTFLLPPNAYIDVPGGYGTYQLTDVRELSVVETGGKDLLARAITTGIGIPVSALDDELTIWDSLLTYMARSKYQGKQEMFDLSSETIFSAELRADGEDMSVVDTSKVASLLAELLWEKQIINERLTVGVFNASGTSGLATSISRMLETMGVHVVDTTNWEEEEVPGTCMFRALEPTRYSVTLARLTSVIDCDVEFLDQEEGRFDIKLVLNELPL